MCATMMAREFYRMRVIVRNKKPNLKSILFLIKAVIELKIVSEEFCLYFKKMVRIDKYDIEPPRSKQKTKPTGCKYLYECINYLLTMILFFSGKA